MAITHNIESIIKGLDLLEKSVIPQALEGALKDYGFYWRQFIQTEMKRTYSQTVRFTERSPYFKVKSGMGRYELLLGISDSAVKGNPPKKYLGPTDASKGKSGSTLQPTRFAGALKNRGITRGVPIPMMRTRAGRTVINAKQNLKPGTVTQILGALGGLEMAPKSKGANWFLIRPGYNNPLTQGIYRRYASGKISMAFALAEPNDLPRQKSQIDFRGLALEEFEDQFPVMLNRHLRRLLGR